MPTFAKHSWSPLRRARFIGVDIIFSLVGIVMQLATAEETQIKYMRKALFALKEKTKDVIQRFDVTLLQKSIPNKTEFVIVIALGDMQRKLYDAFLGAVNSHESEKYVCVFLSEMMTQKCLSICRISFFVLWHTLAKIWNHPQLLLTQASSTVGFVRQI